jgi:endonuclease YncB( thermonuclease family)
MGKEQNFGTEARATARHRLRSRYFFSVSLEGGGKTRLLASCDGRNKNYLGLGCARIEKGLSTT